MAKKATKTTEEEIITTPVEEVATETEQLAEQVEQSADQTSEAEVAKPEKFTKSGKKSKKHLEEVAAEEARKAKIEEQKSAEPEKKTGPKPKTRTRLERRSKSYRKVAQLIEKGKSYTLENAIKLALETTTTKFDATLEAHIRLGVDPRQADQNIRATVSLPHGTGKTVRVAVFAPSDALKSAKEADIAEDEEFLKRLEKEQLDFDILITTPAYMPKLGKFARLLGPKGLMPNPKAGTVTQDIAKAVTEMKAGKIEYRVDKQAIVHIGLGKLSFGPEKLLSNAEAFLENLKSHKPSQLKGTFVKSLYLTTTMGPSIQVENTLN